MIGSTVAGQGGSNLDVAQAIGRYLDRANGDTRLALAFSVADGLVFSRLISRPVPVSSSADPRPSATKEAQRAMSERRA